MSWLLLPVVLIRVVVVDREVCDSGQSSFADFVDFVDYDIGMARSMLLVAFVAKPSDYASEACAGNSPCQTYPT